MRHFDHPIERFKRFLCKWLGHVPSVTDRGEPVVTEAVVYCKRCGRFERSHWRRT